MDVKYVTPFLESLIVVLDSFGIKDVKRDTIVKKNTMRVNMDITSVIGLVGGIRGNVAYSMSQETAKKIVSEMIMGLPESGTDEVIRNAIGELANMITGKASSIMVDTLVNTGLGFDVTPPSVIFGTDMYFIISSVQAIAVTMLTSFGNIEVNIGLEM